MTEIVVVGFQDDEQEASRVLDDLRTRDDKWILELADAVALHRDLNGLVTMDQSYRPTGRHAEEWGRCLGILIGASLSIPVLVNACPFVQEGVMVAAGLGRVGIAGIDASFWEETLTISRHFFDRAGSFLLPGNSAIFAVLEVSDSPLASARFTGYGGKVLQLSLSIQQQAKIERLLKDGSGSV